MHPELIKAHIRMKGTTPAAIADELGVTSTAVAHVINGQPSARIRAVLARVTGLSEAQLWPAGAKPQASLRRRVLPKGARDRCGFPLDVVPIGSARPHKGGAE